MKVYIQLKELKQKYFSNARLTLLNKLQSIDENILSKDDSNISKVLLFGDDTRLWRVLALHFKN